MAKISRGEFLDNIRNIINESMNERVNDFDGSSKFGIRRYVSSLVEEGNRNPNLMSCLLNFDQSLNEGAKEFMLFKSFRNSLLPFAKGNRSVKTVLEQMDMTIANNGNELEAYTVIENEITEPYAQKLVKETYNAYIADKTQETLTNLIDSLDLLYEHAPSTAQKLKLLITDESYNNIETLNSYVNESAAYEELSQKMQKEKNDRLMKEMQEKIESYANEIFDNAIQEDEQIKESLNLASIANNNGIGLTEAIKVIVNSDAKHNEKLMETVDQYAGALVNGAYEERLYETFVNNITKYSYLLPVEKAIKMVNENVEKRNLPITITKILEEMADTMSYYIVPLIEEDCARFVKYPTPTNRVQLRNALVPHAADPYVYAIIEAIDRDDSKSFNSLSEKAMSIKDQIKMIRQNASVSNLYSPVQYIKENECVFNANGQFYVKKGNALSKLDESYLPQLSEKFVALCQIVNDPRVSIDEDYIVLAGSDKVAYIYEGYVDINGNRESRESLRDLNNICMKYDYDTNFYIMCSCLHENFNNIAKINFAKHVTLNENKGINFDLFRLGDNIFINTVNEAVSQSTFYRDVNPIQCKNIINNHMGINVSNLFEDLIPSQEKIIMRLNETQNEYESAIEKYDTTIEKLEKTLGECNSDENKEKLENAIATAKKKLESLKKEYKDWQKEAKNATDVVTDDTDSDEVSGDGEPRKETTNEPLDDSDIDAAMDDLTTPMDNEDNTDEANGPTLTDDEFETYLKGGDDSDEDTIPELPTDDTELDTDIDDTEIDDDFEEEPQNTIDVVDDDIPENDADTETDFFTTDDDVEDDDVEDNDDTVSISDEDEMDNEEEGDAATDIFGGNINDPLAQNDEDVILSDESTAAATTSTIDGYKIANVLFDENIKNGEKYKSGTVNVIIPMVSGDGKVYVDNKDYDFYINDEGQTVLDNEEMPAQLYITICDAIKNDPHYNDVLANGIAHQADVDNVISTWSDDSDDDTMLDFNIDDTDDSWTLSIDDNCDNIATIDTDTDFTTTDDILDDSDNLGDIFTDFSTTDDTLEDTTDDSDALAVSTLTKEAEPVIPTYKSGKTEIELPAANIDKSNIPAAVTESRKSILKISPEYRKNGKSFFLIEGTVKPSKKGRKEDTCFVNEGVDGSITENPDPMNANFIEDYNSTFDSDTFAVMFDKASQAKMVLEENGHFIKVTPINFIDISIEDIRYFTIEDANSVADVDSYTIYTMGNNVYYRPSDEFYQIYQDIKDNIKGAELMLTKDYATNEDLSPISILSLDDCLFLVTSIIQSLTGLNISDNSTVNESCKIRKPRLTSGHDFEKSKFVDDILHGDKEKRDFEEKIEKDTLKAGIDNPLAPSQPQQEEAVQMRLPNAHSITESYDITYEPMDKVIYKEIPCQVISVSDDGEKISILVSGKTIDVKPKEIKPDPLFFNELINTVDQFDFDKNKLTKDATNEKLVKMNDLNGKTVECNIIVDGHKVNMFECYASLTDIIASKKTIRVLLENGNVDEIDTTNINFVEKPYAVIVDSEGKPVRSIKVDPMSYIDAQEDEMVNCEIADKATQFPKKIIKILS